MTDILSLPEWVATNARVEGELQLIEASCSAKPSVCPKCGCIDSLRPNGTKGTTFFDSPIRGLPVRIKASVQRYMCKDCSATSLQPLPGIREGSRMTERCTQYIEKQSLVDTYTRIAENIGCDDKTIRLIAYNYIRHLNATYRPQLPEWMGVDETQIDGVMRCIITDVANRKPVDMLPDRGKQTLSMWLNQFKDRSMVKAVSTDMWKPYRDVVNVMLPGVPLVVDKFHILRTANYCMERVRIRLQKAKKSKERRVWLLSKHILNKRYKSLRGDQREKLEGWLAHEQELAQAYKLKESFYDIFDLPKEKAVFAYDEYANSVPANLQDDFKVLITSMKNWRSDILAYFDNPITNAYTEALNGVAKVINRQGRGYSFEVLRARLLFSYQPRKAIPRKKHIGHGRSIKMMLSTPGDHRCHSCRGTFDLENELHIAYISPHTEGERPKLTLRCMCCIEREGFTGRDQKGYFFKSYEQ